MTQWKKVFAMVIAGAAFVLAASKDEEAVRIRIQEFQDAFNKHDAKVLAAFWTPQGDLITPTGTTATGPAEIEKAITSDLTNIIRGATSTFTIQKIRFLKPDICIVNMTHDFAGGKMPDGTAMPPGRALVTGVASKTGANWMWEAARPMIPFTPPTGQGTQMASPTAPAPAKKPAK